jgi:hypothetical protein
MRLADIAATRPSVYAFVLKQTYSPEGALLRTGKRIEQPSSRRMRHFDCTGHAPAILANTRRISVGSRYTLRGFNRC